MAVPILPGDTPQARAHLYIETLLKNEARRQVRTGQRAYLGKLLTDNRAKKTEALRLLDADLSERDAEIDAFEATATAQRAALVADRDFARTVREQIDAL